MAEVCLGLALLALTAMRSWAAPIWAPASGT
jgi:hypothetical protein